MKNILVGLSTQNRAGKYLYYGAYNTDAIQTLVAGELGIFWSSKSTGPDESGGVYTPGGGNDDKTSNAGINVDNVTGAVTTFIPDLDRFFFAQGTGNGKKAVLGSTINAKDITFKVLEYVAPTKKIQTVTIAAASLVAGNTISFSAYSKNAPIGATGTSKEMNIEYLIKTVDTATTIAANVLTLIKAHPFFTISSDVSQYNLLQYNTPIYAATATSASTVIFTITWNVLQDGDIKNNSWATAPATIATTTTMVTGNGMGDVMAILEKECAVEKGYNPAPEASLFWSEPFYINTANNYHLISISWRDSHNDQLGINPLGLLQTQYIAIDTADGSANLLSNIVSILTDMTSKRAINSAA